MKQSFLATLIGAFGLFFVGCSEDTIINNYDIKVENVEVQFGLKSLTTEAEGVFGNNTTMSTMSTTSLDDTYEHVLPTSAKIFFVVEERRGNYNVGDVVEVMTLSTNTAHTITIPALKYRVYATNYDNPTLTDDFEKYAWYTYVSAENQLPLSSNVLYMIGSNVIDYTIPNETGLVEMVNHYSAVMIKANENISDTTFPMYYGDSKDYILVDGDWYLRYIRNTNTNTKVTYAYQVNGSPSGTLSRTIEPNKIYQYTFNGVQNSEDDGFVVSVSPLQNGEAENIDLF